MNLQIYIFVLKIKFNSFYVEIQQIIRKCYFLNKNRN